MSSAVFTNSYKVSIAKQLRMLNSASFLDSIQEEDDTMIQNFERIKHINRHGYLTVESQAGLHRSGINPQTRQTYSINERAYIAGFIPTQLATRFIKLMSLHTDKIAQYVPKVSDTTYLPSQLDVPLTVESGKVVTHMSPALPVHVWDMWRTQCHIHQREPVVFVECYDPKWDRHAMSESGLFTDVLHVLNMILKPSRR